MYSINATETRKAFNTTITNADLEEVQIWNSEDEPDAQRIHEYGYKPTPVFMGGDPNTSLMYGIELEVDNPTGNTNRNELATYIHKNFGDKVYCKRDGSLTFGVEIVSHPATLAYHMRKFDWASIIHACEVAHFSSHDTSTCGLHIHVGRAALGNTNDARDLCVAKMLIVFDKFYENEIYKISRRRSLSEVSQWAAKNCAEIKNNDSRPAALLKAKYCSDRNNRYTALNLCNTNTVEVRFFKGTLNPVSFAAAIQFVDSVVRYCKTHTLQEVVSCKFGDIVDMCRYPELRTYCERRGVNMEATGSL